MKTRLEALLIGLLLAMAAATSHAEQEGNWREEFAYMTGKQAYMYGFPAWKMGYLRQLWIEGPRTQYSMDGANAYVHYRKLADPSYQQGTSMNRDTLYSITFSNVAEEPLVYVMPKTPDGRYLSIEFTDWYTDAFAYLSQRDYGNNGGAILIHYRGWNGKVPTNVDKAYESPTPWIVGVGRTFTTNTSDDLKIANALQNQMRIYKLSEWLKEDGVVAEPVRGNYAPVAMPNENDPLGVMKSISAMLVENPPPPRDEALITQFGLIGIGPKAIKPIDEMDEHTKRGLVRAVKDGHELLRLTSEAMGSITNQNRRVNGWVYNPGNWGRTAETGDFLGRAGTQSFAGGLENWVEEAVKLRVFTDQHGANLNGSNRYTLRFEKDQIPKVDAFWSITLYDNNYNVVNTGYDKFAIRDIDESIVYGDDGSLSIVMQSEPPTEKGVNWLPTPKDTDFNLFFRAYFPDQSFIDQSYEPPAVMLID